MFINHKILSSTHYTLILYDGKIEANNIIGFKNQTNKYLIDRLTVEPVFYFVSTLLANKKLLFQFHTEFQNQFLSNPKFQWPVLKCFKSRTTNKFILDFVVYYIR